MNSLKREDILMKVRNKLSQDGVKLWLEPYFTDGSGTCKDALNDLGLTYCKELNEDLPTITLALKDLQANAIEKISAREKFKNTGIATLKVRISANRTDAVNVQLIEILLTENGIKLKEILAEKLGTSCERLKLIANGRVLHDEIQLGSQSIRNGMQLMALELDESHIQLQDIEKSQTYLNSVKSDAQLLAGRRDAENVPYLQLTDQAGEPLRLPKEEEQALSVAMALHEKGRAALKSDDFSLALIFFLEADKEFSQCNSKLLECIDNYALLNLDIAWCYLNLKDISQLPNAEERLKKCEENFHKSYGTNLERLLVLKGATGNEAALFFRLHLIQAIVQYHNGKRDDALRLLERAEREYNTLKVDDASICSLMELGYTMAESRLALRTTQGDMKRSVDLIEHKRKERIEKQRKEQLERSLGLCKDGRQWVNIPAYNLLTSSMGFDPKLSAAALRLSNNATPLAVQMLQDQVDVLENEVERVGVSKSFKKAALKQLTDMGFDIHTIKQALKKCKWNPQKAIECITQGIEFDETNSSSSDESEGTSSGRVKRKKEEAAYARLSEGMSSHEEDHLDLTLNPEFEFLKEYKELIQGKAKNTS